MKSLGARGEGVAARFLSDRGYGILARNYTCSVGELDLVAIDDDTIVFVEVKTRRSDEAADPEVAVHAFKRRQVTRAARFFLMQKKLQNRPCRFDVVAVVLPECGEARVEHFIDAFEPRPR